MKHFLLTCLLALPLIAFADSLNYLTLTNTSGSAVLCTPLSKTQRITFDGDAVNVKTADGNYTAQLSTLATLQFVATAPTGVQTLRGTWEPQNIIIYNVNGVVVRRYDSTDERRSLINLNNLPAGVYIVKEGSSTRKWLKR